ncbi:MAG: branched chain amino acid aminotransferase [Aliiglaciecola sp.]
MTLRIAMWSGPRNISTAMMRSWENRSDCSVVDEPFYSFYLNKTQSPHPLFEEVVASQSSDYDTVTRALVNGPCSTPLQYQKHMTHHMLDNVDLRWTEGLKHCFLIRDPHQVVNSYFNSRGVCTAEDIGIIRQAELFQDISAITGQNIPVVDSNAVLNDPHKIISALCDALEVSFDLNMLAWPQGTRESDGVWAKHWYHSVNLSTGFAQPQNITLNLTDEQMRIVEEVMPAYLLLKEFAIG